MGNRDKLAQIGGQWAPHSPNLHLFHSLSRKWKWTMTHKRTVRTFLIMTGTISPSNDRDEVLVPDVGMRFEGIDEAFMFWKLYSCRTAFGACKRTLRKHTNQDYNSTFRCSRGRQRPDVLKPRLPLPNSKLKGPVIKRRRRSTPYTGCEARMIIEDRIAVVSSYRHA